MPQFGKNTFTDSPSMTDEMLMEAVCFTHDAPLYGIPLTSNNLLCIAANTIVFSPYMLYEALGYQTDVKAVRTYLSLLIKSGSLKTVRLPHADGDIRKLYYITRQGFNTISVLVPAIREFHSRSGKRVSETGIHDYGVGYAYLAYLVSPYRIDSISYEQVTSSPAAGLKHNRLKSIRHDCVLTVSADNGTGKIYLEYDTGTEPIPVLAKKLPLYASHGLMDISSDILLITFRRQMPQKAPCFRPALLSALITDMADDISVARYRENGQYDRSMLPVLDSLERYTPAFKKGWKKADLSRMLVRLRANTEKGLFHYYERLQNSFSAGRHDKLLAYILTAYQKHDPEYEYCINCMLSGFRVITSAAASLSRYLPIIHMEEYPDITEWLCRILTDYYGQAEYAGTTYTPQNPLIGKKQITLHNLFRTQRADVCVEYLSADISSFFRAYGLIDNTYDARSLQLSLVLIVDRMEDAVAFSSFTGYQYDIKDIPYQRLFLCFLLRGSDYLFMIGKDNKECRLRRIS